MACEVQPSFFRVARQSWNKNGLTETRHSESLSFVLWENDFDSSGPCCWGMPDHAPLRKTNSRAGWIQKRRWMITSWKLNWFTSSHDIFIFFSFYKSFFFHSTALDLSSSSLTLSAFGHSNTQPNITIKMHYYAFLLCLSLVFALAGPVYQQPD